MGQKVNPKGFRIGQMYTWDSKWYSRRGAYADAIHTDLAVKKFVTKQLKGSNVAKVEIERTRNTITIIVHSSTPGMIIGRQGAGAEELKAKLKQKFFGSVKVAVNLTIVEVSKPGLNAQLVVQEMALQIEKRMPYRRVLKQAIDRVQKAGARGVKVVVAGRLNGSEIARTESLSVGSIPLHTLRAHIDYSRGVARTIYGAIGIKVWIYKGEFFDEETSHSRPRNRN